MQKGHSGRAKCSNRVSPTTTRLPCLGPACMSACQPCCQTLQPALLPAYAGQPCLPACLPVLLAAQSACQPCCLTSCQPLVLSASFLQPWLPPWCLPALPASLLQQPHNMRKHSKPLSHLLPALQEGQGHHRTPWHLPSCLGPLHCSSWGVAPAVFRKVALLLRLLCEASVVWPCTSSGSDAAFRPCLHSPGSMSPHCLAGGPLEPVLARGLGSRCA
uniref:Uncharacterized protein n=1 Tax=Laticauda laticaudata TaxID=8630 RepID=A0A8C5S9Q8_LATLA